MTHEEAESAVIGGLLLDEAGPQTFDVLATLAPEAFSTRQYREMYQVIKQLAMSGGAVTPFVVADKLGDGYEANRGNGIKPSLGASRGEILRRNGEA
ncbi:Replicative DNA helicase [Serratia odorifera]|uniref:Replicative DNA helicase n=1 Tax=Serratia odorifera TaxID=618 RepID=A0A447KQN1_SEROD|nr:DnaB-like helicase N-terminal domain-containing protein [Serratia odorifera]VDZ56644.1 Replicative DNA helicase [Serratia odorifera]